MVTVFMKYAQVCRAQATCYFFNQIINKPAFPSLADEIAKLRPYMNFKVAAFTVTKTFYHTYNKVRMVIHITRTHSMMRHRKSPRSRRNLMVIDPLAPSQGHQFDCRLKFSVYPGILPIPFNLICHMTMF